MKTSVKQIAAFMDSVEPAGSVMDLADMHRWLGDRPPSPFSVRKMLARHTQQDTVKVPFLFYNTFLMPGIEIEIPFTVARIGESPRREERASEIGKTLRNDAKDAGMFAALCEVWNDDDRDRILDAWPENNKPNYVQGSDDGGWLDLQQTGSGLLTISPGYPITRGLRYTFDERGSKTEDADFYSNKGVLLTEIDLGVGFARLEVYNTHLFNGGFETTPPDLERIDRQLKQVDELIAFVRQTHLPQNVALIVGDFNIPAHSNGYNRLMQRLEGQLNMVDIWKDRNGTPGHTSSFYNKDKKSEKKDICALDKSEYCDDAKSRNSSSRIDYIFIEKPQPKHGITVDFTRPRRRPFMRKKSAKGFEEIKSMSDHLGIETTLIINSK